MLKCKQMLLEADMTFLQSNGVGVGSAASCGWLRHYTQCPLFWLALQYITYLQVPQVPFPRQPVLAVTGLWHLSASWFQPACVLHCRTSPHSLPPVYIIQIQLLISSCPGKSAVSAIPTPCWTHYSKHCPIAFITLTTETCNCDITLSFFTAIRVFWHPFCTPSSHVISQACAWLRQGSLGYARLMWVLAWGSCGPPDWVRSLPRHQTCVSAEVKLGHHLQLW